MHRLAHRVRPALRSLRRVHTGSQEQASAAAPAGLPRWATAAAYTAGLAATYYGVSKLTEPGKKAAHAPKREVNASKPALEPAHAHDASAVEPTALVAAATDAPPADASITTDNALTESHSGETHAEVVVEGEDGEPVEGGGPKVAAPYDPETGEFNWDCPCLGGMPDTICGEQFKESFRCFVKSEAEPKGMDCIEAFNAMQQCFREHPEVYAREIEIYDDIDKEDDSPREVAQDAEGQLDKSVTTPVTADDSLPPSSASPSAKDASPPVSETLVDPAIVDAASDVEQPWGEAKAPSSQTVAASSKPAASSSRAGPSAPKPASTTTKVGSASTEANSSVKPISA